LQENSKEGLAIYYQTHLSEVEELQSVADELAKNPTPEKINTFMRSVNIYVENELQRQNVKFLKITKSLEK
jgi:2-iminoacetate synthase ThiH